MGTLNQRMTIDMKNAMKVKDKMAKGILTLIRSSLTAAEKEKKGTLTEAEETVIIQRELKQTHQTLAEALKANRQDIVDETISKIAFIESYLPEMMTEDEIVSFLQSKGAKKGDHIGKITGMLMKDNKGKVDGSFAKEVIEKHFA